MQPGIPLHDLGLQDLIHIAVRRQADDLFANIAQLNLGALAKLLFA
ncbi:MAG TPA: hypothetical protein VF742_13630 [Terracidiphilus sp.]